MADISNRDDVIDSRDVIERVAELEMELEDAFEQYNEGREEPLTKDQWLASEAFEEYDDSELTVLQALQEEAGGYAPDWKYGAQLIRETYFTDYCQELCADIGDVPKDMPGYLVIDWEATAHNIKIDYTEVDFDGVTYLIR